MKFWNDLDDDLKKKLRMFVIIIGAVLVVVFLIILFMRIVNRPTPSYTLAEREMKKAAEKYYQENTSALPTADNGTVTVSVNTLVAEKYMKELSKLVPDKTNCSGEVEVIKNGEYYLYAPKLECGDNYKTNNLQQYMSSHVTTSSDGIYSMNQGYVYRGDQVDNYLKMNNRLWRIVKVDGQGVVTLIYNGSYISSNFDDRYNNDVGRNYGYNDFRVSRMKDTLQEIYDGIGYSEKNLLFKEDTKKQLISYNLCHGARDINNATNDGSIECGEVIENQVIGLLSLYDYINASLDQNCHSGSNSSCQNYNYLYSSGSQWWTMTKVPNSNYQMYYISSNGNVNTSRTSYKLGIRPVVFLNAKASIIASGTGTATDPFVLQ